MPDTVTEWVYALSIPVVIGLLVYMWRLGRH